MQYVLYPVYCELFEDIVCLNPGANCQVFNFINGYNFGVNFVNEISGFQSWLTQIIKQLIYMASILPIHKKSENNNEEN